MNNTKTPRYEFRCSHEELKVWHEAAALRGMKLSAYTRMLLNNKPIPSTSTPPNPELLRQLAAIGNNLNQLARFANTYKQQADTQTIEADIGKIKEAILQILEEHSKGNV